MTVYVVFYQSMDSTAEVARVYAKEFIESREDPTEM